MVTPPETLDLAYHWAPTSRRRSIRRVGLKPGSASRAGGWRPPFVALSRDPAYAIASAEVYHPITYPMDLWQLDLVDLAHEDLSMLHDELRIYVRVPYRDLTYIGTRQPDEEGV